jgi:hypothetical protein
MLDGHEYPEPRPESPERRDPEEVKVSMRKFVALALVALVSLTMVLAAVGCGKKADEASTTTTTTTTTTPETSGSSMMSDSAMADTSMQQ